MMLGITLPDAVLVSTLVLSVLAAWRGGAKGDIDKAKSAPALMAANVGMAIGDTAAAGALTQAIIGLTDAVNAAVRHSRDEATRESDDLLRQILEQLKHPRRGRAT